MTQLIYSEGLTLNPVTQQVSRDSKPINLPELSYRTLLILMEKAPAVVSIDQLIDEVWQDIEVSSETVTQRIALLRKSLSTESENKTAYISSVRNKGYRWVPEIKYIEKQAPLKRQTLVVSLILVGLLSLIVWFKNDSPQEPSLPAHQAQDEYLSQAWRYLDKHDLKSNQIAIELFRKSLQHQANNANAMIGISLALSHQVTKFNQSHELLIEAKELAEKAVGLYPDKAEAWEALGFSYDANGEIDKAIELYEKSISLDPNHRSTKGSLAYLYSQKGRLVEAMQLNISVLDSNQPYLNLQIANGLELLGFDSMAEIWYKKADELSPDNVFVTHQRARFYVSIDQLGQAKKIAQSAIQRGIKRPELYVILGLLSWMEQDVNQAHLHFQQALKIDDNNLEANLWNFISPDNKPKTMAEINSFENNWFKSSSNWPDFDIFKALFFAHYNRFDDSINSIETAYHKGFLNDRWLKKMPPFKPLLKRPRFQKLIERMQNDIGHQKQQLLEADWLPISFLDPQNY